MAPNPVSVRIDSARQGDINCVASASYFQRLTLTWPGHTVVFQGTGEHQPMTTHDGQTSVLLASSDHSFDVSAKFEYSTSGSTGPFHLAQVSDPIIDNKGPFTVIQVVSEDAADNDLNDSYLTIATVTDSTVAEAHAASAPDAVATGQLELHAKTYYNNPQFSSGDEHYVTIPSFGGETGAILYSGTGWSLATGTCWNQRSPLGGYLHVYVRLHQCIHEGMHDAVLILTTTVNYWGSFPTGGTSVEWVPSMSGTQYKVTRVTN